MIDSHAHILSEYYNIDEIVKHLKDNNVKYVINCSTCLKDAKEVIELSKKYINYLLPAIGIHPENIEDTLDQIEKLIKTNKIYAIGEIGLDYYWNKENKEEQKELFIKQIELANKYDLPIIVHTRDSIQDCLDILKKYKAKGVIHCFTGSYEMAKEFIKLGFKLGIGGVITFKNSKLSEVVSKLDINDLLIETDSPYLTPEPNRGKQNNPANVYYVAKKIAEIKNMNIDDVLKITGENAIKQFDLKL